MRNFIIILLINFTFLGCKTALKNGIMSLDKNFDINTKVKVDFKSGYSEEMYYKTRYTRKDTNVILDFSYIPKENFPFIYFFAKSFKDSLGYFHQISFTKKDTLFHFKTLKKKIADKRWNKSTKDKIFIRGWYGHKYIDYTSYQRFYYIRHKDSLLRIPGNNLPELPNKKIKLNINEFK